MGCFCKFFATMFSWFFSCFKRLLCIKTVRKTSVVIEVPEEVRRSVRESVSSSPTFAIYTGRKIEFLPTHPVKGIEGGIGSSHLDSLFFAMFATTNAFDSVALAAIKTSEKNDKRKDGEKEKAGKLISQFHEIRTLVRGTGCNAAKIREFRELLGYFNNKVTSKLVELDVVIQTLFGNALALQPFVEYTSNVKRYYHEIMVACQDACPSPSGNGRHQAELQAVFESSMISRKLTFARVPSPVLFLKVSRNLGETAGVIPNLTLDITEFIDTDGYVLDLTRRNLHLLALICRQRETYSAFCRQGFEVESGWIHFNGQLPTSVMILPSLGKQLESLVGATSDEVTQTWDPVCTQILTDIYMCIYASRDDFTGYSSVGMLDEDDEDIMYSAPASARMSTRGSSCAENVSASSTSDQDLWRKCLEADVELREMFDKEKLPHVEISRTDTYPHSPMNYQRSMTGGTSERGSSFYGSEDGSDSNGDADNDVFPTANDILTASYPEVLDLSPEPSPRLRRESTRLASITEADNESNRSRTTSDTVATEVVADKRNVS